MFEHTQQDVVSMESNILYPMYYRRHGVRRAVQLVAPPLSPMETLDLPRESILHFISDDEALYGIPSDDYILREAQGLVMVEHITELGDVLGPPRPTRLPYGPMVRDYHRKYRKMRPLLKLDVALRNPRTVIVENYALLPHLYRYTTSFYRSYYKWWNIQAALWKRVGVLADQTDRQQYLQCRLPKILPNLAQLRKGEGSLGLSRSTLAMFAEPEALFILELWKWLGPNRKNSVLSKSTPEQLAKMNLIWSESGKWFTVNLGLLDEWRKPTAEELEAGVKEHGQIDAAMLQRRFLRLLMFLYEVRTVTGEPEITKQPAVVPMADGDTTKAPEGAVVAAPVAPVMVTSKPIVVAVPQTEDNPSQKLKLAPNLNVDALPDRAIEETEENILAIDEAVTKDLEALSHLHRDLSYMDDETGDEEPVPAARGETPAIKYQPQERTLVAGIMSKADALADNGLLSGAEYRRFQAISTAYTKLPDPYGEEDGLSARMTVNPRQLKLDESLKFPDIPTVTDKSMLKSTLEEFDSRYIKEILRSDVTRSVVSLQHAGVAVTGYNVETIEDALNAYEAHTVELSPVQGKSSTIHFRIPKVGTDGTFKANGVRYRLRKQRGDMPIRKLSSSKVALTSYYSKLFVSRSEKVVHNYAQWLTNQIAAIGMDPENKQVSI